MLLHICRRDVDPMEAFWKGNGEDYFLTSPCSYSHLPGCSKRLPHLLEWIFGRCKATKELAPRSLPPRSMESLCQLVKWTWLKPFLSFTAEAGVATPIKKAILVAGNDLENSARQTREEEEATAVPPNTIKGGGWREGTRQCFPSQAWPDERPLSGHPPLQPVPPASHWEVSRGRQGRCDGCSGGCRQNKIVI